MFSNDSVKKPRKPAAPKAGAENSSPTFRRARIVARGLFVVMGAFLLAVLVVREPFAPAVGALAAMPWIALALVRGLGGLYSIGETGKVLTRVDLDPLLLAPGLGLLVHANIAVCLVHWTPELAYATAGAVAMAGAMALASPAMRQSGPQLTVYAIVMGLYGGGLGVFGDVLFDAASPEVSMRPILEQRQNSTGKYTAIHYAKVGPWGPFTEANEVEVSRNFAETRKIGDAVCMNLHPGALGAPWYTAGECRRGIAP